MSLELQKQYYDTRWGEAYLEELDCHQLARLEQIRRAVDVVLRDRPLPWKVVEVGCGTGWLSNILSEYGQVTGIDLSEAGVVRARERYPRVDFVAQDIFAQPMAPAAHDLVVASEVIEHIEAQQQFIDLLVDTTAPGGYVLLTTPNGDVEWRWKRRSDYNPQPIEKWVRPAALCEMLEQRCDVVHLTTFYYDFDRDGAYRLMFDPRYQRAMGALRLDGWAERMWGRMRYGLYTVALARRRRGG